MAPKLRARSGSKKTGKSSISKADKEPNILKKRRVTRRRLSLNKLGGFECSGLDFYWLNTKRGRSNARIRRTDFTLISFSVHGRVQSESNIGDVPTDSPVQSPLKVYERRKKSGKVYERRKKRGSPNSWLNRLDQSECDANNDDLSSSTFTALAAKSVLEDANTLVVLDQVIVDEQKADECSPFTAIAAIEIQRKIVDEPTALAAIETQEKTVDGPMALAAIETQQKIVDEPIALAATETQQKVVDELMVGKIGEHDNSSSRVEQDVDLGEKANSVVAAKVDAFEPLTPPTKANHTNLEKDNGSSEIGHSSSANNRDRLVLIHTGSESCIDILKKRSMHGVDTTSKKSSKRKKMKRHNPKVVDPNMPFQCSTPMPRTPKPVRKMQKKNVGQLSNGHGEATTLFRKKSCKRKLDFADECSTVDQEELKLQDTTSSQLEVELKLQDTTSSQLEVELKLPKMCKKRRLTRQRISIEGLNNLIRLVREKLSSEYAFIVLAEKDLQMKRLKTQVQGESFVRKSVEHCEKCADEDDTLQDHVFLIQDESFGEAVHDFLIKKMERVSLKDDESDQLIVMQDPKDFGEIKDSGETVTSKKKSKARRKKVDESDQLIVVQEDPKDTGEIVPSKKRKTQGRRKTSGQLTLVQDPNDSGKVVPSRNKKTRDKPEVDIDSDTLTSWKLLMDGKWSEATEAEAVGDWDYMKNQRKWFSERCELFIRCMRVVHGSREFTPWKGSILDSIVGVYLTQNTGDSLSSSAFMNLRAKYPPLSLSEQSSLYCRDNEEVAGPSLVPTEEPKPTPHVEHPVKNGSESHSDEAETRDAPTRGKKKAVKNGSESHSDEAETGDAPTKGKKKGKGKKKPKEAEPKRDWESWRKQHSHGISRERTENNADSMDYEAIRQAPPEDIAAAIVKRGMSNQLARRLKGFLNRLMRDHGSLDLEWLKHVPPTEAKDYLMSFNGLALKSTECVRLLALHVPAFPVDTNAGRFFVRWGLVPLKPMPDSLKLHLLNQYPVLNSIQQYVWPRLCDNCHGMLYELHCYSVTVAKTFCTKVKPNCVECPMNGDCMHYASLRASANYNLEGSQPKSSDDSSGQEAPMLTNCDGHESIKPITVEEMPPSPVPDGQSIVNIEDLGERISSRVRDEPSIVDIEEFGEMLPSQMSEEPPVFDIEDFGEQRPSLVPDKPSAGNIEDLGWNLAKKKFHSSMPESDESCKCLVATKPRVRLPVAKLNFGLSTGHIVFELPDSHPLLATFDKRDSDDPYPYCFAIYLEDDPVRMKATTCDEGSSCCSGEGVPHHKPDEIRGTIMIPCRTANRGAFPLNGTYFQPNELFADHESSQHPIVIPSEWLGNLNMRMLYCGKSITSICKGIKQCEVQYVFNSSYICVREFDRKSRSARPLGSSFHYCKLTKSKKLQEQKQVLNSRIKVV